MRLTIGVLAAATALLGTLGTSADAFAAVPPWPLLVDGNPFLGYAAISVGIVGLVLAVSPGAAVRFSREARVFALLQFLLAGGVTAWAGYGAAATPIAATGAWCLAATAGAWTSAALVSHWYHAT